jgi:hypothetical protein
LRSAQAIETRSSRHTRRAVQRQTVEDLEQLELVVEVMLEPEDDLVHASCGGIIEDLVAPRKAAADRFGRSPAAIREEVRATLAHGRGIQAGWHGALMQNVVP